MQARQKTFLLVIGIAISVLLIAKGTWLYQKFFDYIISNNYYDLAYSLISPGKAIFIPFIIVVSVWFFATIYYYVINSARLSRWWWWMIMHLFSTGVITFVIYKYSEYRLNDLLSEITEEVYGYLTLFVSLNAIIIYLLFVVVSFSIRWWSSNCDKTPFPR